MPCWCSQRAGDAGRGAADALVAALAELQCRGRRRRCSASVSSLQGLLDTYQILPRVLAREPLILNLYATRRAVTARGNRQQRFLSTFNAAAGASRTFRYARRQYDRGQQLRIAGVVGRNFAFRPYFSRTGWAGCASRSTVPGRQRRAVEVAVVKIGQGAWNRPGRQSATPILVTDAAGVVFIATNRGLPAIALRLLPWCFSPPS